MKRLFVIALAVAMLLGLLCGCAANGGKMKQGLKYINNPSTYDEWLNNAKIESLTSLGNTNRLKDVIERAKNGEELTIAYIGGSITEGDHLDTCYAARSYRYFCEQFAKKGEEQVTFVNAGISGTPSNLGALRFESEVLAYDPNIVFIEFAVNDGNDNETKDAFECLIRACLDYETKPAVVLLFSRMEEGWTSQDWKKEIGAHYDVSMISYADGITYMFDNNVIQWSYFSHDYAHPHAEGNALVNEFISYFYDEVDRLPVQGEAEPAMPERMYAGFYQNAHLIQRVNDYKPTEKGSWRNSSSGFHYDKGWTKTYDDTNDPLVIEFTGKNAYVLYPTSGNQTFGTLVANIYFNGELVATKEFDEYVDGGWMCPSVGKLYRSPTVGEYCVEFSVPAGQERTDVQVLAVAYTD